MLDSNEIDLLLRNFDMGASTAENDPLLENAKIETMEFQDLYFHDRIDIVKGIKGSGKTAIYRLFFFLKSFLSFEKKLYCIFGVEATGDPVFRYYQKDFADFTEVEFENFWNLYFLSLIYNEIYTNKKLRDLLKQDLGKVDEIFSSMGLKISKNGITIKDSIGLIQKLFRSSIKLSLATSFDPSALGVQSVTPQIELEGPQTEEISQRPIHLGSFRERLTSIFMKHDVRVWVMIDRLDEIFQHRSEIERRGLRGILKSSYNISHPHLRVKTFLRDDIISFLAEEGFTALTHVTDRCSPTMAWSKDDLIHLITKRLGHMNYLGSYFSIDKERIDKDQSYREEVFYQVFPARVGKMLTMDWLYTSCADANGVVTPRDVIDFFRFAKAEQTKESKISPKPQEKLLSESALKKAMILLSKHKKETFLFAEFPHLKDVFLKFDGKISEYDEPGLQAILGKNNAKLVEDLKSIGFLKLVPKSGTYKIAVIWRKGFTIRRNRGRNAKAC